MPEATKAPFNQLSFNQLKSSIISSERRVASIFLVYCTTTQVRVGYLFGPRT